MQDARRSTSERAERSLENSAVSAPQVGGGLNGKHYIPRNETTLVPSNFIP
jgi:hypothetical protein